VTFCRSNAKRPLMEGNAWSICWGIAAHLNVAALDAHRTAGVDGLCGETRKMTGRENLDFARRTSSARVLVTMRRMGGPHAARIARAAEPTPAESSFKAVYGRLNCDRREKSSFSTQST
jgi:hypothetical protein